MVYIDMNMVRAGVVDHPAEWKHSGYHEIQSPPERYAIIDIPALIEVGGFKNLESLQLHHRDWVNTQIKQDKHQRQSFWSNSVAVGSEHYVETVQEALGVRAKGKNCQLQDGQHILKEAEAAYHVHFMGEMDGLST